MLQRLRHVCFRRPSSGTQLTEIIKELIRVDVYWIQLAYQDEVQWPSIMNMAIILWVAEKDQVTES